MNTGDRLDELTQIKGIGPARQRWFREALNVRTYHDLASLSADVIEARLKVDGQIASRSIIESWLRQAGDLAALLPTPAVPEAEVEWKSLATFVIYFQEGKGGEPHTTANHVQSDTTVTWPGFNGGHVCRWMLETAREVLPETHPEAAEAQPVAEPPSGASVASSLAGASLHITRLQIFQPPSATTPLPVAPPAGSPQGFIRGDDPFALEVSLQLIGAADTFPAGEHPDYLARFYAYDHATGRTIHLGEAAAPADATNDLSATVRLPEAGLSPSHYRLYVVAALPTTIVKPGYLEAPMLNVV